MPPHSTSPSHQTTAMPLSNGDLNSIWKNAYAMNPFLQAAGATAPQLVVADTMPPKWQSVITNTLLANADLISEVSNTLQAYQKSNDKMKQFDTFVLTQLTEEQKEKIESIAYCERLKVNHSHAPLQGIPPTLLTSELISLTTLWETVCTQQKNMIVKLISQQIISKIDELKTFYNTSIEELPQNIAEVISA